MFQVTCPNCKQAFAVQESQIGTQTTCSNCLQDFVVERSTETRGGTSQNPLQEAGKGLAGSAKPGQDAEDLWAEDRLQLAELLNGPAPRREPTIGADQPYDFTVACPLCGTRQEARSEQVGRNVRCPDCHSDYPLREPAIKARRQRHATTEHDDRELRLSEPVPTPVKAAMFRDVRDQIAAQSVLPVVPSGTQRPRTITPQEAARDTFSRAERERNEQPDEEPPLPREPMKTGVLRFLQSPAMIVRIFFYSLGLWLECAAIQAAIHLTDSGPIEQFFSVILRPFSLIFGILLAANFARQLLTVVRDTVLGHDDIHSPPGANPADWFVESWPMFASLFVVLLLPAIAAQGMYIASYSLLSTFLIGAVPASLLLGTVFPIVLLSFLENSTPFSREVLRGLQLAASYWTTFIFQGSILAAIGQFLIAIRLAGSSGVLGFVVGAGAIVAGLVFFRLLGRLTWVSQVKLAEEQAAQAEE